MPSGMLTDPSDPRKAAAPLPAPPAELTDPSLYLNRELTWLAFNERVLAEGEDDRTPLLERVKFVAIVASNLDEFFMKRIGGLKQQVAAGLQAPTVDGRTPKVGGHSAASSTPSRPLVPAPTKMSRPPPPSARTVRSTARAMSGPARPAARSAERSARFMSRAIPSGVKRSRCRTLGAGRSVGTRSYWILAMASWLS